MKRILKWIGLAILCPVFLVMILTVLLYLPPVQNWVVDKVAALASEEMGMQISVGRVGLAFPLDLSLEHVGAIRGNDTVANARQFIVEVPLLPLLKKQVVVDRLELNDAQLNTLDLISDLQIKGRVGTLHVSSQGIDLNQGTAELNGARLEDADLLILLSDTAAVDTTTTEVPWLVHVDSLVVARSRVEVHLPGDTLEVEAYMGKAKATDAVIDLLTGRYTVQHFDWGQGRLRYDNGERTADGPLDRPTFDANHIALTDIGLGIDSLSFCSPELLLKVREAKMKERCGLELTQLQGSVMMDSTTLRLPRLHIKTPYSNIRARCDMDFSVLDSVSTGRMALDLDASLGKQDVLTFLTEQPRPLRSLWPEWPLHVETKAVGNLDKLAIERLRMTLPGVFHAEAKGYAGLPPAAVGLDLQAETYDLALLTAFVPDYGKDFVLPKGLRLSGKVNTYGTVYAADLLLRDGSGVAKVAAHLDQRGMSYDATASIQQLNVQRYLPSLPMTSLTAQASAKGKGFDFFQKTCWMEAEAQVRHLQYGSYHIDSLMTTARLNDGHGLATVIGHNELLDGQITADALLDTKSLKATVGTELNNLNIYALNLVDKPMSVGACGHIDLESNLQERHYLSAFFSDLFIKDSLQTHRPEDVGLLLRTNRDTTLTRLQSGNLILKMDASGSLEHLIDQFVLLSDSLAGQFDNRIIDQPQMKRLLPSMSLSITSGNDNPVANFLRSNNEIDFREMQLSLTTSPGQGINGYAFVHGLYVDSTRIDTVKLNIVEKAAHGMTFNGLLANSRRNPQLVFRMLFDGLLQEHGASVGLRYFDRDGKVGLRIGAQAVMAENGINFHLVPAKPTIGYREFTLNADNFLFIQDNLRLRAKVDLISEDGTGVKIYSEEQDATLLQDLTVSLHRIDLGSLTGVLPFMPYITGELNGDYHLVMDERKHVSVASDMNVRKMTYENSHIGNIATEFVYLQREDETHAVEGRLLLDDKEVGSLNGEYRNVGSAQLNAHLQLTHFPLELGNGFIPDQLVGFEGFADGDLSVKGTTKNLDVNGEVYLDSAALISVPYGVRLRFDNDPVRITNAKLLLENFTMYAYNDEPLNVMGDIDFHNLDRIMVDMRMRARNYQIINAKQTTKSIAYGKAFVNFYARMNGQLSQLRMRGRLDVLGTTDLGYVLLDSPLSTDNQMDELVKFTDFKDSLQTKVSRPIPDGLDVDLTLSIDQGVHVKCALNIDQTNYVDLFGGGDLRMRYNTDGISLTGRYTMSSGEMKYSLPIIPLKTFTIQEGSFVEFTGDPTNPRLNLTATERTKASVEQEGQSSRSVAFDCGVVITKTLNDMGLEFIVSSPEDSGVANELAAMTTEQRGKLAVTMLTTGMYLADGNTSGFSMNSALSSFLQSEINNITGNALKTLDVSMGLDNTIDASGAMHTDYSFKFAKRFWNNRLKVQIGGKVSSGKDAGNGQNQSFFDNVTMEYRLSPTSNQYVKLFYKQNVYDWLEGYTGEYGGGFIWRRRLDNFWDILRFWRKEQPVRRMPVQPRRETNDSIRTHEAK